MEDGFGCQKAPKLAHFGVLYGVSGALRSIKLGLQNRAFLGQVCPKQKVAMCPKKRRIKPSIDGLGSSDVLVFCFGASWGRFRAPKLMLQPSKMLILLWEFLHV